MPEQARQIIDAAGRTIWVDAAGNEIRDVTRGPGEFQSDLGSLQAAAAQRGSGVIPASQSEMLKQALRGLMQMGPVPQPSR